MTDEKDMTAEERAALEISLPTAMELCRLGPGHDDRHPAVLRDRDEGRDSRHRAHPDVRGQADAGPHADRGRAGHPGRRPAQGHGCARPSSR
ncbi:MAG: hypothetical protein MZW92_09050 [Comamonadaceae bacterium]|nr:hypothetical protein [Comamonadaceae bacterium]